MAIDVVVSQEDSFLAGLGLSTVIAQLWALAILTLIVWGLESMFEYLYQVQWRNLAQTLQHELRTETYDHVQKLDMAYFEDQSTGELMSIMNDDVNQLERFLDIGANEVIQVVTTVVVIGVLFFILAPTVAWMAFLPMPLILYGSIRFQKSIAPHYANVRNQVGILNGQSVSCRRHVHRSSWFERLAGLFVWLAGLVCLRLGQLDLRRRLFDDPVRRDCFSWSVFHQLHRCVAVFPFISASADSPCNSPDRTFVVMTYRTFPETSWIMF
jgi:hypothetical protein